jgi:diguanylate cyclase (GGDEF)-like protein
MEDEQDFFSNPQILGNYALLQEIGVFQHISRLNKEIRVYKSLLSGATEIFNRTSIDEIMDATVWQISDQFLPSFIVFLWKPFQNKSDITIKSYKNYKMVDLSIRVDNISSLEPFFQESREPINYDLFRREIPPEEVSPALGALDELAPKLVIPILGPSGLYGLILVGAKILADEYAPPELDFLRQLMAFVSQAIQNHLHYEHSVRDAKTGLFNHGFFITRINEEIARVRRTGCESSLLVLDVDKFKNFNDSYGHMAGDRVLENIALVIQKNVRAADIPSRFGGEEFTILLPDTGRSTAWVVAERLRCAIAGMKVPWDHPLPQVTISLGLVTFDQGSDLSADHLLDCADEALYRSKKNGRNRTTMWGAGLLFKVQSAINE